MALLHLKLGFLNLCRCVFVLCLIGVCTTGQTGSFLLPDLWEGGGAGGTDQTKRSSPLPGLFNTDCLENHLSVKTIAT